MSAPTPEPELPSRKYPDTSTNTVALPARTFAWTRRSTVEPVTFGMVRAETSCPFT
jgi:hypothetical protein